MIPQHPVFIREVRYHWGTTEVSLAYHWRTIEVPLGYHWGNIEVPLRYHWGTIDVPLMYQWAHPVFYHVFHCVVYSFLNINIYYIMEWFCIFSHSVLWVSLRDAYRCQPISHSSCSLSCNIWQLCQVYLDRVRKYKRCSYFRAKNTAHVQRIRCSPKGSHLMLWTSAVFSHIAQFTVLQ